MYNLKEKTWVKETLVKEKAAGEGGENGEEQWFANKKGKRENCEE